MKREINKLKSEFFDILIIGGGINGCAIARDAALRGAKVALIEKNDFASGASGNSTKLIHGGLRYLEQFNFKLIREALSEREILLKTATQWVRPLEFIVPVYKGDPRSLFKMKMGIFLYDRLAGNKNIAPHRHLKKRDILALEPGIQSENLLGGVTYWDAQMDDVGLCLANALSAYEAGACVANKVEVIDFIKAQGRIEGTFTKDNLTGENFEIRAGLVINTTGAWSNLILNKDRIHATPITRPTKGIHLVTAKLPHTRAILFSARSDKRVLFAIPWHGFTLIGTTDTVCSSSPDEVYAVKEEVSYLLKETRRLFPSETLTEKEIITTFAGLRPLIYTKNETHPSQVSREHLIKESESGLLSVVGGKYTTYRKLAEEVVNTALLRLSRQNFKACVTHEVGPSAVFSQGDKTIDLRTLVERAVNYEMANSLSDLLFRRLKASFFYPMEYKTIESCAQIMATCLNWPPEKTDKELSLCRQELSSRRKSLNSDN